MKGGVLAVAETPAQAMLVAHAYPQATIVALTAAVDAWREREGRADPTIEDISRRAPPRRGRSGH